MCIVMVILNFVFDLVGCLVCIEIGEVNMVEIFGLYLVGKGINVVKVLVDLGVKFFVIGFLGEEN